MTKQDNPDVRVIVVDGLTLAINQKTRESWRFITTVRALLRAEEENDESGMLAYTVDVISMLLGDQMDKVLKHLGPDPSFAEVREFHQKVVDALNAKNS